MLQHLLRSLLPLLLPTPLDISLHLLQLHLLPPLLPTMLSDHTLLQLLRPLPTPLQPTLSAAHTAPLRTTIPGLLRSQLRSLQKRQSPLHTPTLSLHTAPLRTTTHGLLTSQPRKLKSPLKSLSLLRAYTLVASRLGKIQAPTLMPSLHSTLLHHPKRSQLRTIIRILTGQHPPKSLSLRLQLTDTPMDTVTDTDTPTDTEATDTSHPTDNHGLTTITSHTHLLRRSTRPRSSLQSSSTTNTVSAHSPTRATPLTLFSSSRKSGRPRQSRAPSKAKA